MTPHLEVVVPVCDAESRVPIIIDHYARLGVRPLFIVDERSRDGSLALLESAGARVMAARSEHARVESLLFDAVPRIDRDWILRFDDDEAPTGALLDWIDRHLTEVGTAAVGFSRRWVGFGPDGRLRSSSCVRIDGRPGLDWQFRLFRPSAVRVIQDIHTPGFMLERHALAPEHVCFHHFSWIVRTSAERRARIAHYETQSAGAGCNFTAFYLPEDRDAAFYDFTPVPDPDIESLAHRLARARASRCAMPTVAAPTRLAWAWSNLLMP